MSQVITLSNPADWPIWRAAMTPAAGPDSAVRTGCEAAASRLITPPFDWTIRISLSPPRSAVRVFNWFRYSAMRGCR